VCLSLIFRCLFIEIMRDLKDLEIQEKSELRPRLVCGMTITLGK